jgi:hypothetical protein
LEELVRFKRTNWTSGSSDGSNGGSSGKDVGEGDDRMDVDPADTAAAAAAAGGSVTDQQQQQDGRSAAPTRESYLQECDDEWQPPGSISYLIVPLKDAAAGTSGSSGGSGSSGQEDPQLIPAEAYPSLNIAAAGTAGHTSVLRNRKCYLCYPHCGYCSLLLLRIACQHCTSIESKHCSCSASQYIVSETVSSHLLCYSTPGHQACAVAQKLPQPIQLHLVMQRVVCCRPVPLMQPSHRLGQGPSHGWGCGLTAGPAVPGPRIAAAAYPAPRAHGPATTPTSTCCR